MKIEKLTPYIGAIITDINLADDGLADQLRWALVEHGVIFLPAQNLNAKQLLDLAEYFGEPVPNPHPKFGCVENIREISLVINDAENPADINVWHSDLTFHENPATTCVLQCMEKPPVGGDTLWASMTAAYDHLSEPMKSLLDDMRALHQLPLDGYPADLVLKALEKPISAMHPVVRFIPESGRKSLFINRIYTQRIEGLTRDESQGVLDALFKHAESPDFQVRYRWGVGDIAIWDNRSTQHFAVADYFPERRVMHRVAMKGAPVVAAPVN